MSNFDKYIRRGEPHQAGTVRIWQTAIGLQDVDGLKPSEYLLRFFRNLIFSENTPLSNREMHISSQSIAETNSKSQFDALNCTLEEIAVLKAIQNNGESGGGDCLHQESEQGIRL